MILNFSEVTLVKVMFLFFFFQLCEDIFVKISDNTDNSMSYSVEVRYLSSAPAVYL